MSDFEQELIVVGDKSEEVNDGALTKDLFPHQKKIVHSALKVEKSHRFSRLNDKVGSGKTYEVLSMISLTKSQDLDKKPLEIGNYLFKIDKFANTNVIFANTNVFKQWTQTITDSTNLTYFEIPSVTHLKKLKNPEKYDVILIKNGTTNAFVKNKKLSLVECFRVSFPNYCFKRVFFDDYMPKLLESCKIILALNTWIVSADQFKMEVFGDKLSYYNILKHEPKLPTIKTEDKFLNRSMNIPKTYFQIYLVKNAQNYGNLLNNVGGVNQVVDALNGDAINTAAEMVGIKCASVFDIFRKVLKDKTNHYIHSTKKKAYTEKIFDYAASLEEGPDYETDFLAENIMNIGPFATVKKNILEQDDNLKRTIKDFIVVAKKECDEVSIPLQRIRENIRVGECPITANDLKEVESVVILPCCGIVLDATVTAPALKIDSQNNGTCPYCRAKVNFKQCIFVKNDELSFDSLLQDEDVEAKKSEPVAISEKIDVLKNIINENLEGKPHTYAGKITQGMKDIPLSSLEESKRGRKIIIFADFEESVQKIRENLTEFDKVAILHGSTYHIDDIRKKYWLPNTNKDAINILVINSDHYAQGMNLQNTTDLIFYHRIPDKDKEAQMIGRALRIGRECNLQVKFLSYYGEY